MSGLGDVAERGSGPGRRIRCRPAPVPVASAGRRRAAHRADFSLTLTVPEERSDAAATSEHAAPPEWRDDRGV